MTYTEIQELYKRSFNKTIKTCWIADVKRQLGLTKRKAVNRNNDFVEYPCPDGVKEWLIAVLNEQENLKKKKPSDFRGALKLTADQYADFQSHIKDIRNEWGRDI